VDRDEYLKELTRYIHLNPVRAGIVQKPEDYLWTSYHEYVEKKPKIKMIDKDILSKYMDLHVGRYREFVHGGIGNQKDVFKNLYGGFLLGRTSFIKDKLKTLKHQVEGREVSYKNELSRDIEISAIVEGVAKRYKIGKEEIYKRKRLLAKERQIIIYLARRLTSVSNSEIGKVFEISSSGVSKAAGKIESLIENDRRFEKEIKMLYSIFRV
jgi:hypothetical protein